MIRQLSLESIHHFQVKGLNGADGQDCPTEVWQKHRHLS